MSLYGMVFGQTPYGPALVGLLATVAPLDPGRFRDAWVERHGDEIVVAVYTRNGGGNREDQGDALESMHAHPWFRSNADDEFDSTYATLRFTVDVATVVAMDEGSTIVDNLTLLAGDPVDTDERWLASIKALKADPNPR